ncbi:MBL fold metallo-hydrolase [Galbibacter sp.]|uniref:MBL fold metallo-hydrolase n=1 Tax=Galbibacter sp. TaxID=2918471 RepID=UPI003A933EFA
MRTIKTKTAGLHYRILILLLLVLNSYAYPVKAQSSTRVFHIQNYFSEVYLVENNNKLVLIETGVPVEGYADSLAQSIEDLGFKTEHIALAIVTHGHGDHAGNAHYLQETFDIPIVGSQFDFEKFTSGKTELAKSKDVSIWGTRLRPNMDMDYPAFTPDILVGTTEVDLKKFGIDGKIIPLKGGHTPGGLTVLIGNQFFIGDAFIGTFALDGASLVPDDHHVREHFYHENTTVADQVLEVIEKIAKANNVTNIYPTHFGPVTTAGLSKYINEKPILKELSKLQASLLKEIEHGDSDVANTLLSKNFNIITPYGQQFAKTDFIQQRITSPKTKIETVSAEDFRIVKADNNTAIMTFLKKLKITNKEPQNIYATAFYTKIKDHWELVFEQDMLQQH